MEKNRICSWVVLFMVSLLTTANPITHLQALRKAQDFVGKRMHVDSRQMKLAHVGESGGQTGWFAFNLPSKKGFVIVSGNDETDEILGYSNQGEFDYENIPENMKVWLEQYNQSIQAVAQGVMRPAKTFAHPTDVVEPLITSLWGQKYPFNVLCPKVNATNCPAGCTAVAMAQVMRYHRFPAASTEAIPSYTTGTLGIDMPELPATTFDWDKMPDELTDESSPESINEVAKLMLYCGQATEMNYDASGSGAYSNILPQRLPKYFNYPKTIHYVYRRSYDEAQWDSLLVRELLNGRPVIYTAYTNISTGHTFVCDGYDGQGLYHINWGWTGAGNGYYRISVACAEGEGLDENIKNYQLSVNQSAVIGIKPEGTDDYKAPADPYCVFSRPSIKGENIYKRSAKKYDFKGITIKQTFVNGSASSKSLNYGVALCDDKGNVVKILANAISKLSSGANKAYEIADVEFGAGLAGHYTIKAVYKPSSSADWIPMGGTDRNYIDVEIEQKEMTLTSVPKANFVVQELEKEGDFLKIRFDNNDEDFFGIIYLRKLVPSTGQISLVAYDNISFEAGTSRDFRIYVDPAKSFDIYSDEFYLSVDEYDSHYFYCNAWEEDNLLEKEIEILNLSEDSTTIVGDRAMCRVTVTNKGTKPYKNYLVVSSLDGNDKTTEATRELIELAEGDTLVRQYEVPITDFDVTYSLMASHKRNLYAWDNDTTEMKLVSKGAIYWTKDGTLKTQKASAVFVVPEDAVAINVRNAYTSNVTPNSNPNTIYMLDKTIPSRLASSNYVGATNKGKRLTLVDGFDYYFPVEMTFSAGVYYQREIPEDVEFEWATLTLPFTPEYVSVDDSLIGWYADADAKEGDFWLFDFKGVQNDTVTTSYSQGVKADVPCLMAYDDRLAAKTISFYCSEKTTIAPTQIHPSLTADGYSMVGTNMKETTTNCYLLQGNEWVWCDTEGQDGGDTEALPIAKTDAFRAFITTKAEAPAEALAIDADSVINPNNVQPFLLGDVNHDGHINMTDVVIVINYILGTNPKEFYYENANVTDDDVLNMLDVIGIISIILR